MIVFNFLLVLALSSALYFEWAVSPVPSAVPPVTTVPATTARNVNPLPAFRTTLKARGNYELIAKRPLFLEGRAPDKFMEEPNVTTGQQNQGLQGADLSAVLILPDRRVAWVRDHQINETLRLAPNDVLRGWTVEAIQPQRLFLRLGTQSSELELRHFNAPPVPAAAAPPPTQPVAPPAVAGPRLPRRPGAAPVPGPEGKTSL